MSTRKKKVWLILLLTVIARVLSLWFLKPDLHFVLVPRSFTGRSLLSQPAWLDIAVPLVMVILLWPARLRSSDRLTSRLVASAALDAVWLLLFPLLVALALFVFVQRWFFIPQVTIPSVLRWLQFVLAFLALNLLMDALPVQSRWGRAGVALLAGLALGPTQDLSASLFTEMSTDYLILGILFGVGTTLAWVTLAFRPLYRRSPWRAVLAAIFVGSVTNFLIVAGRSDSLFTFLWPALALPIGALTIRSTKTWPRWAGLVSIAAVGLSFSLIVLFLLPPDTADLIDEWRDQPAYTEQVGDITIHYDDPKVQDVAVRMARVLEAANVVSQEEFGVSPQVDELTIWGIQRGGFYSEFPHSIKGNLVSERQIKLYLDASFLNDDPFIHFPDPINAILHEYSHLYGAVHYWPWIMGPEEEGWATYAATRLSLRLFDMYGPDLWDPPYDYAAWAKAITESNLKGRPVFWSHPHEFGGFQLWHVLGVRDGEDALFRKRWELTQRNLLRFVVMESDPSAARRLAKGMGEADFVTYGAVEQVRLGQIATLEDWRKSSELVGLAPEIVENSYDPQRVIDPQVDVPARRPLWLDLGLALVVCSLAVGIRILEVKVKAG